MTLDTLHINDTGITKKVISNQVFSGFGNPECQNPQNSPITNIRINLENFYFQPVILYTLNLIIILR